MQVKIKVKKKLNRSDRLLFFMTLIITLVLYFILAFLPKAESAPVEEIPAAAVKANKPPPLKESIETIQRGVTLSDILEKYDFSPAEVYKLRQEVKPVYDLARIKAGKEFRLYSSAAGNVVSLKYYIDSETYLSIIKNGNDYSAEIKEFPIEIKTAVVWGSIENMLISAIQKTGESVQLAIELADLFAWDIDFYADMRAGDAFKIYFEKKYLEGEFIGYGKILSAEFTNQGESFEAFRYVYPDTKQWDYFTYTGNSLRKEFLKSPINGARITSRFSHSRLHPVRKVYRPHYGVDYGAPVGTPAQATADGTVTFAGRSGASGRMVRIRHKNAYETAYLHLSRFGKGIRKGVKVTGGQVIGYVGASGEVSGPHLDYRIRYHGTYVNPLAHKFKPVAPLKPEFLLDFQENADNYRMAINAPFWVLSSFGYSFPHTEKQVLADQ